MTPEERQRRIKQRQRARQAGRERDRRLRDELLAEVLAAKEDPQAQVSFRRSAAILGIHHQSLSEMLQEYRARTSPPEQAAG